MDKNMLYVLFGAGLGLFLHRYIPYAFEIGVVALVISLILLFKK